MEAVVEGFFPDLANLLQSSYPSVWRLISFDVDDDGENGIIHCDTPFVRFDRTTMFTNNNSNSSNDGRGIVITHPFLAISAIVGFIIGIYYGLRILRAFQRSSTKNFSQLFYGLSFLFFSGMNLGGIFFHCLQPPFIYLEDIPNILPSSFAITHIAHVVDVCSTCCTSLSFLFGRLHAIEWLHTNDPSFYYLFFAGIYIFGYIGMIPTSPESTFATTIPFLAEILYPGVVNLVLLILPFCRWQFKDYPILFLSLLMLCFAFGLATIEFYLCQYLGPFFTAAGWCFFFSDLTFILLAQLSDVANKVKKL